MGLELAVSVTVCFHSFLSTLTYIHMYIARFALQMQNRRSLDPGINWIRNIF